MIIPSCSEAGRDCDHHAKRNSRCRVQCVEQILRTIRVHHWNGWGQCPKQFSSLTTNNRRSAFVVNLIKLNVLLALAAAVSWEKSSIVPKMGSMSKKSEMS